MEMKDYYDFFRHRYCILFEFTTKELRSMHVSNDNQNHPFKFKKSVDTPSIIYNTNNGSVIARGLSATTASKSKRYQKNICYVPNVFTELHGVYLREQHGLYNSRRHDIIIIYAVVKCLQDEVDDWEKTLESSKQDFRYAFTLSTNWDNNIQKKLLHPILILAGFIDEKDHNDRLLVFSKLEVLYESIKWFYHCNSEDLKIIIGRQYAICSLDFDNGVCVDLELFSVQYPLLTAIDSNYVPQSLKSVNFRLPFKLTDSKAWMKRILETRCSTKLAPKFIKMMTLEIKNIQSFDYTQRTHPPRKLSNNSYGDVAFTEMTVQEFFDYQPFNRLKYLTYEKFNLTKTEISNIKLLTMNDIYDIYEEFFHGAKTFFMDQIGALFKDVSGPKVSELFIVFTDKFKQGRNTFVLLKLVEKWLKEYGDQQVSHRIMAHNNESERKITLCSGKGLLQRGKSNKHRDPKIVSANTKVESFKPIYFINIDFLPTTVNLLITQTEENNQAKNLAEKDQLDIQPLSKFFIRPNVYGRQVLCISIWMKLFIKDNFGEYLELYLDPNQRTKITNEFVSSESNILDQILSKVGTEKIFSKKYTPSAGDDRLVNVCHPGYVFFFKIMYFHHLNRLIKEKLNSSYENDWRNKNTAFAFSVEKKLFDNVFGSDETLDELLVASGMLKANNKNQKVRVSIYGEEIIHAIQHKLKDVNFQMKSYFVVAQVHSDHIQLTLHQVVKLATSEENAATIIVDDEIIHMEDVHDTLHKKIWKTLISSNIFDCCSMHETEGSGLHNLNLLRVYKNAYQQFKILLINALSMDQTTIDMDSKHEFKISNECSCKITLLLRDIIENGIKPVIQDITTTIAASMANTEFFGHYEVGSLFILGNPFSLSKCSSLYAAYTLIVQKEISIAMELKEKDINAFVLQESFCHLLKPVTLTRPYMYDRFIQGVLTVISNATYGVRFGEKFRYLSFNCMKSNKVGNVAVARDGEYLVFLQKDLVEVPHVTDPLPGKYAILKEGIGVSKAKFSFDQGAKISHNPIILDIKRVNYNYTLQISVRWLGCCADSQDISIKNLMIIEDPLTLAYI
ncbi:uncharacterized protein EV154DRAFT_515796 [Mucor mucedo]|uniref:uncharacterized protein n=1 Tax=Mucor mucedo TaxID=29922 RepID=UPI00221F9B9F|nr:uncharacterized protein EV154DRAFT_515796 [Mucor mucedo]KAI7889097.1 hypothetical protein EV154DRAFT_515796 [Mucor mucedo]